MSKIITHPRTQIHLKFRILSTNNYKIVNKYENKKRKRIKLLIFFFRLRINYRQLRQSSGTILV